MAKSPSKSPDSRPATGKAETSSSRRPPAPSGNGNRAAEQAELDLQTDPDDEAAAPQAVEDGAVAVAAAPAAPTAGAAPTPPTLRELGLTGKEAWKVDLNGKRVNLTDQAWREELARALGRAPAKA